MRSRKLYVSQTELDRIALSSCQPAQAEAVNKLVANGFRIYRVKADHLATVVLVTHPNTFGVVYPDGQFHRALKGKKTVNIDWARAHALMTKKEAVS